MFDVFLAWNCSPTIQHSTFFNIFDILCSPSHHISTCRFYSFHFHNMSRWGRNFKYQCMLGKHYDKIKTHKCGWRWKKLSVCFVLHIGRTHTQGFKTHWWSFTKKELTSSNDHKLFVPWKLRLGLNVNVQSYWMVN